MWSSVYSVKAGRLWTWLEHRYTCAPNWLRIKEAQNARCKLWCDTHQIEQGVGTAMINLFLTIKNNAAATRQKACPHRNQLTQYSLWISVLYYIHISENAVIIVFESQLVNISNGQRRLCSKRRENWIASEVI